MRIDEGQLLLGCDIVIPSLCVIKQPTISAIGKIGFDRYDQYLATLSAEKDTIINALGLDIPAENYGEIDVFTLLILLMRQDITNALSFFIDDDVRFIDEALCLGLFHADAESPYAVITADNYNVVRDVILEMNFIKKEREENLRFKSEAARKRWERSQAHKREMSKNNVVDKNQSLRNLVGAVSARSHTYNLLNIGRLTVYQLYDQFIRMQSNTVMDVAGNAIAMFGENGIDEKFWYKNYKDNI